MYMFSELTPFGGWHTTFATLFTFLFFLFLNTNWDSLPH